MLKANVERQYGATNGLHMAGQAAYGCPGGRYGCHGVHMATQRLLLGVLKAAFSCSEAAHGVHMAAQRLLLGALGAAYGRSEAAHGAAYSCSEAAFGCRGVAFRCIRAVCGSHAADMQYMLHLAGLAGQPGS